MTPRETKPPASGKAETAETAPLRMRDKRFDGYLKGAGIVLATICAVLPFIMYYDILDARPKPQASGKAVRDPLNRTNQKVVRETHGKQTSAQARTGEGVDPMPTATTAELTGDRLQRIEEASKQPFPSKPVFLVREVVGGLVMIEDDGGYWFVEKGSPLPDGSTLVAIERGTDPGSFSIKTSDGDVITRTN
jgi:hypothetical protein